MNGLVSRLVSQLGIIQWYRTSCDYGAYRTVGFLSSESTSPCDVDHAAASQFSREAAGRQSMSEKRRKAYVDPRVTAFYEQVKMARGLFFFLWHQKQPVEST